MYLGKKIAVVGVSASGKSVLARTLADKTRLPLTHVDTIMWKPGWDYVGDEETVKQLRDVSTRTEWIIEGFIDKEAFDYVLGKADSIIYLDYPRYIPAWRYTKRWLKHRRSPRPELEGSPETLSLSFLRRIWEKREVYHLNKFLHEMTKSEKIIRLKSPKDAEMLTESVGVEYKV